MRPTQREQRAVAAISAESDSESDEALEPVEPGAKAAFEDRVAFNRILEVWIGLGLGCE